MNKRFKWLTTTLLCLMLVSSCALALQLKCTYAQDADSNPMPAYEKIGNLDENDIICVDVTRYQQQKNDWNKEWKDFDGNTINLFTFLKAKGVNTVSVKIAVDPKGDAAYLSKENAIATAREAKAAGLKTNIVLLYSDSMTWRNTQTPPASWMPPDQSDAEGTANVLQQKAEQYTEELLGEFKEANASPDIVTIGNELNYNFLNIIDENWRGWNILRLLSKTVKDADGDIAVAYSFAAPENASDIQWVLSSDNINNTWNSADYDYIGVNLYSDTHDTEYIEALKSQYHTTQYMAGRETKLLISSINYPYIDENSPDTDLYTQIDNIYEFLDLVADEGGFVYNEGDLVGSYTSLFADGGDALPSLGVIEMALTGKTDATIDPYRYGGEFGLKDIPVTINPVKGMTDSTIKGVDISSYQALKDAGVKFYNNSGNEASLIDVLKDNGVNYIRLRVWNDPYNADGKTYGGGSNDEDTSLEIAKEATKAGMRIELCMHYSDFWADPAQQLLPKAWQKDEGNRDSLKKNVYDYTKAVLTKYKDAGVDIGMVQIGNEITNGAFGIMRGKTAFATFWRDEKTGGIVTDCLNEGCRAVRETCPDALVALHLDANSRPNKITVFKAWEDAGIDYDVLGISYYPFWGTKAKNSSPEAILELAKLAEDKGKLFCVFETSWPTTLKDADGKTGSIGESANISAYGLGVQAQVDELTEMYTALMKAPNGIGGFYWEPAWIPVKPGWAYWTYNLNMANTYGTGWCAEGAEGYFNPEKLHYQGGNSWGASTWENLALFDNNGYPLQSLRFYKDAVDESSQGKTEGIIYVQAVCNGKRLGHCKVVRAAAGETKEVALPKIPGYEPASGSYKFTVTGTDKAATTVEAEYIKCVIRNGQKVTFKGASYVVTKAPASKAKGTVALVKAKNARKFVVPASIRLKDNKVYNVTTLKARSFTGRKLRTAVLGTSVKTISKNTFKGSKVTKLIVKTKKLTKKSVKGSLKSSRIKKIYVKVGKKSVNRKYIKKYKKIFTKKNAGKAVKVK